MFLKKRIKIKMRLPKHFNPSIELRMCPVALSFKEKFSKASLWKRKRFHDFFFLTNYDTLCIYCLALWTEKQIEMLPKFVIQSWNSRCWNAINIPINQISCSVSASKYHCFTQILQWPISCFNDQTSFLCSFAFKHSIYIRTVSYYCNFCLLYWCNFGPFGQSNRPLTLDFCQLKERIKYTKVIS